MCKWVWNVRAEGKNIWEFEKKELKSLAVDSILLFFIIFFISCSKFTEMNQELNIQMVRKVFENVTFPELGKVLEISLCSIFCTFVLVGICKCFIINRGVNVKEKYYFLSTTVLDKIAYIFLSALGILIVWVIYTIIWFLLGGIDFVSAYEICNFIGGVISFGCFLWSGHILFKYPSEKLKKSREAGECNGWIFIIFMVLFMALCYFSVEFLSLCLNLATKNIK